MKILIPFDGSESSKNAVQYALDLVKNHPKVDLTILTVACYYTPYARDISRTSVDLVQVCQNYHKDSLDQVISLFDQAGIKVNTIIESGDPAEVIIQVTKQQGFDKIIMGRRGLGSLSSLMLGSVSTKVLANVDVPVTVIK